jgi:mannan endo-1,6-alpha-mannosidase
MTRSWAWIVAGLAMMASPVLGALDVDVDDPGTLSRCDSTNVNIPPPLTTSWLESVKAAAALVAEDLLSFYSGNLPGQVPGILPGPPPNGDYYWWLGGAMWGTLLDYRAQTNDDSHDDIIMQAMTFQVGDDKDYNPKNWSASMGNDDQAFWGFAALVAAETGFTNPPSDTNLDWLGLAQAVFNEQTSIDRRVNDTGMGSNCNGGLRWQVTRTNNGFDYMNTIVNACYLNIGARLARYTEDDTYATKINTTWDLLTRLGYIDDSGNIYDGAHEEDNCTIINKAQFSYNAATLIQGAAVMYNYVSHGPISC